MQLVHGRGAKVEKNRSRSAFVLHLIYPSGKSAISAKAAKRARLSKLIRIHLPFFDFSTCFP